MNEDAIGTPSGQQTRDSPKGPRILQTTRSGYELLNDPLLNKVLWRFLAEHARKELRVAFSGEFNDDEYQHIGTSDIEGENYVKDWPPR